MTDDDGYVEFTPAGNPVKHGGSGSAYANYGCRCAECKAANTRRTERRRTERSYEKPPAHGLSYYRNWGCRCEVCTKANTDESKRYYWAKKEEGKDD